MIRRPPRSTRTDTRFPYTTLFRSGLVNVGGTEDHGDRSEYLILPERSFQRHIDQDSGGKISAITLQRLAAEQKGCAKLFRFIKLLEHRVALGEAGQRPHVGLRVHGIAGLHHPHRGGERSAEHTSELKSP